MNIVLPLFASFACLALTFPVGASAAVTLVFEKKAEIRIERVRLHDIAKVEGAGRLSDRLLDTDLGRAPRLNKTVRLNSENVVRWVKGLFPEIDVLEWRGAPEVVLRSPAREIPAEEIQEVARQALKSNNSANGWLLAQQKPPRGLLIADLPYVLDARIVQTTPRCERTAIQVDARSDEKQLASTLVWFKKDANTNLPPEAEGNCGTLRAAENLPGYEGQSQAGVEKMDAVSIELKTPFVSIETTGIALSNARVGQPVRVKREGSIGTFMATVIGSGRVRVTDGGWK